MSGDRRRSRRTLAAELALLAHAGQPTPEAGTDDLRDTSPPAVLPGQLDALDLLSSEEA